MKSSEEQSKRVCSHKYLIPLMADVSEKMKNHEKPGSSRRDEIGLRFWRGKGSQKVGL
jgi:hypothetical protein